MSPVPFEIQVVANEMSEESVREQKYKISFTTWCCVLLLQDLLGRAGCNLDFDQMRGPFAHTVASARIM